MANLKIWRSGHLEETLPLPPGEVVLGRTPVLEDSGISRRHVIIVPDPETGDHRIKDLSSRNGTWVNGKHLRDVDVPLHNGDRVQLGRGSIYLQYLSDDATITQTSPGFFGLPIGDRNALWGSNRRQKIMRAMPWIRVVGTFLGILAALLSISFWVSRIVLS